MPIYKAPVDEVLFLLTDVFQIARYNNLPGFADASPDLLEADPGAKPPSSARRWCSRSTAAATRRAARATPTAA